PAEEPKPAAQEAAEPVSDTKADDKPAFEEPKPSSNGTAAPSAAQSDIQAASETSDAKQSRTSTSESVERKKHRGIMGFFKRMFF
ncbi:hypothetical protein IWW40_005268, partial [Coemansia sp. RSA 1250]